MKTKLLIYFISMLAMVSCNQPEFKDLDGDDEKPGAKTMVIGSDKVSLTKKQMANIGLQMGSATEKEMSEEVKSNGIVDLPPSNIASISAPIAGYVRQIDLVPGSPVKKGQIICVLEHPDVITLQQDYLESESKLVFQKQELERQQQLSREDVGALKKLQSAEADYQAMTARVQGLAARLRLIGIEPDHFRKGKIQAGFSIKAPFNGYVKLVHVNLGKYVNPSDVLFELINKDHMHLELKVFEKDINKIKVGQKIKFTLASNATQEYGAEVYLVGSVFEPDSRAVNIHAHLHPERTDFLPGTYVNARIMAASHNVISLPEKAVLHDADNYCIFVLDSADKTHWHFMKVKVEAGNNEDGFTEVKIPAKYAKSDKIVTKGAYYLLSALANATEED